LPLATLVTSALAFFVYVPAYLQVDRTALTGRDEAEDEPYIAAKTTILERTTALASPSEACHDNPSASCHGMLLGSPAPLSEYIKADESSCSQ
jgi:hypothetical protein